MLRILIRNFLEYESGFSFIYIVLIYISFFPVPIILSSISDLLDLINLIISGKSNFKKMKKWKKVLIT